MEPSVHPGESGADQLLSRAPPAGSLCYCWWCTATRASVHRTKCIPLRRKTLEGTIPAPCSERSRMPHFSCRLLPTTAAPLGPQQPREVPPVPGTLFAKCVGSQESSKEDRFPQRAKGAKEPGPTGPTPHTSHSYSARGQWPLPSPAPHPSPPPPDAEAKGAPWAEVGRLPCQEKPHPWPLPLPPTAPFCCRTSPAGSAASPPPGAGPPTHQDPAGARPSSQNPSWPVLGWTRHYQSQPEQQRG